MVLLLTGLVMLRDLHLLGLKETQKREEPLRAKLPVLLVQTNPKILRAMLRTLREKRLVQAIQLVLQAKDSELVSHPANQRPVLLLVVQARQRGLLLHSAKLQD